MEETQREPFAFSLVINGVRLDADTIERVGQRLSDLVLSELASLDLAGELSSEPLPTARDMGNGGFGGTAGWKFAVD